MIRTGALAEGASPEDVRQLLVRSETEFREKAPLSAAAAATTILEGVKAGAWRILVGEDAKTLDAAVRAQPEDAYDYPVLAKIAATARFTNRRAEDAPDERR
ncbi:MAG: hypothetical protein WAU75_12690 [Solirubrobacteraceae bacterium]